MNFLQPETRCNFFVDAQRKKIWQTQLKLLDELMRVCQVLNIKCFADFGTLLGAVRHGGYIPWDDDMDIGLSRHDYNVLRKRGPKLFHYPFFLQNNQTDPNFDFPYMRLRDSGTTAIISFTRGFRYNHGIYIDIHPWDRTIDDNRRLRRYCRIRDSLIKLRRIKRGVFQSKTWWKSIAGIIIRWLLAPIPYRFLCETSEKLPTYFSSKKTKTRSIAVLYPSMSKIKMPNTLDRLMLVPFEYTQIYIPEDYSLFLESAYGDWHKYPPLDARGKWHENVIIFDPYTPFMEYMRQRPMEYADDLKHYNDNDYLCP